MTIEGRAVVYGDNINTDQIFPGRYTYLLLTEEQMGTHAFEDLDANFAKRDVRGDILVAGWNFGCGSSREQAVKCIKQKGIRAVVAKSISRIYYRNCINEGLLPIVCEEAVDAIEEGQMIRIDVENGVLALGDKCFDIPVFPEFVVNIIQNGGIIASVRKELGTDAAQR